MDFPIPLSLCLDVDRDAPFPLPNYAHAISLPLHSKPQFHPDPVTSATYEATLAGLEEILSLASDLALELTMFIEGRFALTNPDYILARKTDFQKHEIGLHGLDHEDFSAEDTGVRISQPELLVQKGKKAVENLFNRPILGFRAPYMKRGGLSFSLLHQLGFRYDSSEYVRLDPSLCLPVLKSAASVKEIPVFQLPKDEKFRGMVFYLWPLFEGNREWSEYISAIREICLRNQECEGSSLPLTLSFHPWHLCYRIKDKKYLTKDEITSNIVALKQIFRGLIDLQTEGLTTIKKIKDVLFF